LTYNDIVEELPVHWNNPFWARTRILLSFVPSLCDFQATVCPDSFPISYCGHLQPDLGLSLALELTIVSDGWQYIGASFPSHAK